MLSMASRVALLAVVLTLTTAASRPAAGGDWETVAREDGILVMMREIPNRHFPTIRTVAVLNESIYDVLAVLSDVERYPQWMVRCAEARRLSQRGELEYVTYSRTDAPWPVSDRDAVYHARATVKMKQKLVMVRFHAVKDRRVPPKDGLVRLDRLQGYYGLKILGPRKTQLDYQLDADPGGWIPKWVGKITAKHAVIDTIHNLRKHVAKTRGWYAKRIARWKRLQTTLSE
jgi:hypothetical protein